MSEVIPYFERLKLIKQGLLPKEAVAKPKKPIAKVSKKRKLENEKIKTTEVDSEMDIWFAERRKEMTGKCLFCGGKTEKNNDKYYKFSIAHIFPKKPSMFPSIATNQLNWIELCYFGNSCHSNFDNSILSFELLKDSKEWDVIVDKFNQLAPLLTDAERTKKFYINLEKLIYNK
jgi:hypothetical protein